MNAKDIIKQVTLPLKYKLIISLGLGLVLFVPSDLLSSKFGFILPDWTRISLSIVFIIFLSFSVIEILFLIIEKIKDYILAYYTNIRRKRVIIFALKNLSSKEKLYLKAYIEDDSISETMPFTDGIVQSLVRKEIIYQASNISVSHLDFAYNLQPLVHEYLKRYPEVLR
ncbi:superinfection exclusion B family protein [bacterium]|nr:superinfection exclusion B family protein [bacterium]